jgi:Adenylate cyclase, family 3 (some proteins contain HAMP domain)
MIIVHYEVYVLEGRGWMLHARFPRAERESAVAEAKELEQNLGVRVKVLRETYYTDDNAFEEAEIYVSGMKVPVKPQAQPPRRAQAAGRRAVPSSAGSGGSGGGGGYAPAAGGHPGHARSRTTIDKEDAARVQQLLGRLFAIVAFAVACAMLAIRLTPEAILLLLKWGFVVPVTKESYEQTLYTVFVVAFMAVAVPLAIRFLPRKTRLPHFHRHDADPPPPPKSPEDAARTRAVKRSLNKLAAQALTAEQQQEKQEQQEGAAIGEDDLPEILPGPDEAPPETRTPSADIAADLEAMAKEQLAAAMQEAAPPPPERPETETPEPVQSRTEAPHEDRPEPSREERPREADEDKKERKEAETAESLQPTIMRFLNGAVNQAKAIMPAMDAYTKFALHLYLTGAVETLCEFRKLGEAAKAKLVILALETLGTKGELARKFFEKIEEYLLEPRYLGVVQAGRNAMGDFMLGDEAGAHQSLRDVFTEWNRKGDKKAQIVTVMFTDMVGSTDMTQARGDAAAQEVVRRHNAIVRGALAQFSGKEIKHTGDGIMASFATAAAAVEASIAIQRQVSQYNKRQGSSDLHLRIGLNAGEPIEEEDDLFGTTVQLAARVCAATNPDQVLCTGVVKDLAFGKGAAQFKPMGEKFLKGFKDGIALFEVVWNG